jgi:hypothetical protein
MTTTETIGEIPVAVRVHNAFGIVSFSIALIAAAIAVLNYLVGSYAATMPATPLLAATIGAVFVLSWFMDILAIGLGIAGARDKTAKRVFSAIGIVVAGATVLLTVMVLLQGLSAAH